MTSNSTTAVPSIKEACGSENASMMQPAKHNTGKFC